MKVFVFLCCLLAFASARTVEINGKQIIDKIRFGKAFENELAALAEKIRETIKNGDEEKGIPILDPFEKDESDLALSIPDTADILAHLTNVKLTGLGEFVVNKLSYNLLSSKLTFDINMPVVELTADDYDLDGNLLDVHLFGNGKFKVAITNIRFSGYAVVSITQLNLKEFKLTLEIDEFQSGIEGILGGGDVSDFINEVLSTLIPEVIKDKQQQITDAIEKIVLDIVNNRPLGVSGKFLKVVFDDLIKAIH